MNVNEIIRELDNRMWKKFYPDSDSPDCENPEVASEWLTIDIASILCDPKLEVTEDEIMAMIEETGYKDEILARISLRDIRTEVEIRKDFLSALKKEKHGSDLSRWIRYSLSDDDLVQLAKLHKANKCRKKIENLLTDCNFHYECGLLSKKEYHHFF